uniref:Ovule protein n=1 Tax=Heterorhabditis bacteriophora TaxID=37862 RepID=A0A1I7W824_HETBA
MLPFFHYHLMFCRLQFYNCKIHSEKVLLIKYTVLFQMSYFKFTISCTFPKMAANITFSSSHLFCL